MAQQNNRFFPEGEELKAAILQSLSLSAIVIPDDNGDPSVILLYKVYSKKRILDMSDNDTLEQALNAVMMTTIPIQ